MVQREGSNGVSHHSEPWPVEEGVPEVAVEGEGGGAEERGILETGLRTLTLEAELARVHALLASNEREAERQQALREARRAKEENQRLRREVSAQRGFSGGPWGPFPTAYPDGWWGGRLRNVSVACRRQVSRSSPELRWQQGAMDSLPICRSVRAGLRGCGAACWTLCLWP